MYVAWSGRLFLECQPGLIGRSVPFAVVTAHTCADHILPAIGPFTGFGHDMIDRHRAAAGGTVLAAMTVAGDDILPGEHDSFERDAAVLPQSHNRRKAVGIVDSADIKAVSALYHFGFALK